MNVSTPPSSDSEPRHAGRGHKTSILHASFEVALLLKGLHAAFEVVGGILLWFIKPETINNVIRIVTQNELAEDPTDFVANLLRSMGAHYTVNAQHFAAFYLVSHGLVNLAIVLLLWRRKLWAYPLGIAFLALFIAYQIFRWTSTHSVTLIAFTVIDAIVIWLTVSEYGRLKTKTP
jgi:uncharacterized membrane protein